MCFVLTKCGVLGLQAEKTVHKSEDNHLNGDQWFEDCYLIMKTPEIHTEDSISIIITIERVHFSSPHKIIILF